MEAEEVGLRGYLQLIFKKLWLVILISVIFSAASAALSFHYMKPSYQAKVQLLIGDVGDLGAITTYIEILQSPLILDSVSEELGTIDGNVDVSSIEGSQIISITVTGKDKGRVSLISELIAETFKEKLTEVLEVENIRILSEPKVSIIPIQTQIQFNISVAFMLGMFISLGLILLIEYANPKLKTEDEVRSYLKSPILGRISVNNIKGKKGE